MPRYPNTETAMNPTTALPEHFTKAERYQAILPQIEGLLRADADLWTANLANINALLAETFGWFWVGFYLVDNTGSELQLSAFQGPVACTRIAHNRGVCGQAWAQGKTLIVPNVHEHPDHIACSSRSQSEIVVPLHNRRGHIIGVLDIDSEHLNQFDETDAQYLQQICAMLPEILTAPEIV